LCSVVEEKPIFFFVINIAPVLRRGIVEQGFIRSGLCGRIRTERLERNGLLKEVDTLQNRRTG
jgi:hypothetical protein